MTGLSSSSTFPPRPRDFTRDFAGLKSWVPCLFQTMAQCDCDLIKLYFYCHLGSVVVLGNYMVLSICARVNTTYTLNLMLQLLCQDQRGCCAFTNPLVHLYLAGLSFLKRAELVKWPPSLTVGLSKLGFPQKQERWGPVFSITVASKYSSAEYQPRHHHQLLCLIADSIPRNIRKYFVCSRVQNVVSDALSAPNILHRKKIADSLAAGFDILFFFFLSKCLCFHSVVCSLCWEFPLQWRSF